MEAFAIYLIKSVIWLSGFALVYILFLRNERYFTLNRYYLISGILVSFFFPLITVHYSVDLPSFGNIETGNVTAAGIKEVSTGGFPDVRTLLVILYISGVLFFTYMIIKQSRSVIKTIKKAEIIHSHPVKLIRSSGYAPTYSFFSYVFVNPSITDVETKEILNHEMVHIRQMHWVDLVLGELLCILQWFNPMIWIYIRFIRQNHEYLADEVALQRTSDPAIYRAVLLNQIAGAPVVSLVNSFNYSLNKKRFNMMKNISSSPWRKMKVFLILPLFAIVLYAFAKPEYKMPPPTGNSITASVKPAGLQQKVVQGKVVQQDGQSLPGASVVVRGTTIGTITDINGEFKLSGIPADAALIVTFVGFKGKVVKSDVTPLNIQMVRDTINYSGAGTPPPPPPPPPPFNGNGPKPLVIIDGKESNLSLEKIDPNSIERVDVLKNETGTSRYGEKGKNGVIIVTLKKDYKPGLSDYKSKEGSKGVAIRETEKTPYVAVEEMPRFTGGKDMTEWLLANVKYPPEAAKKGITGEVLVDFLVNWDGKIKDVAVIKPVNPLLDAEAKRVVGSMPDWKPGKQGGKPVAVNMRVPVKFALH